jgi:hypothetical protein
MAGGRQPGTKKTGGRKKGTPNKKTVATREWIMENANPVEFLAKVMNGEDIAKADGSMSSFTEDHRQDAAKQLLKKVIPDLKAIENSFKDDKAPTIIVKKMEIE